MSFSYSPATDYMTVYGGSEAVKLTQLDMYNADKAGTLTNHSRTGITGTDPSPVAPTYALRPADYRILGGPANDLWLLISAWTNMTSATIRVIGTDLEGVSQQEDIAITGNGTYYTVNRYKTVTGTQVIVFVGTGSFAYKLEQGQWGVGYKTNRGYYWVCNILLGSGTAIIGYLGIEEELMEILSGKILRLYNQAYLYLGRQTDYRGHYGSFIKGALGEGISNFRFAGLKAYGSVIHSNVNPFGNIDFYEIIDCLIWGNLNILTIGTFKKVTVYGQISGTGGIIEDLVQSHATYGYYAPYGGTLKNTTLLNNTYDLYSYNGAVIVENVSFNRAKISFGTASASVSERYTFNFRVTDKFGVGKSSVSVKIYKNGDYTDLTPTGTPIVDTTTDANGDIPEQTVEIWYRLGATISDRNPFLFVVEHADYPTKKFKLTIPRAKISQGELTYPYAEETTGTHAQIITHLTDIKGTGFDTTRDSLVKIKDKLKKHDDKITGLVA